MCEEYGDGWRNGNAGNSLMQEQWYARVEGEAARMGLLDAGLRVAGRMACRVIDSEGSGQGETARETEGKARERIMDNARRAADEAAERRAGQREDCSSEDGTSRKCRWKWELRMDNVLGEGASKNKNLDQWFSSEE